MEERLVQVKKAKREVVILECKSACFHVTFHVTHSSFLRFALNFSAKEVEIGKVLGERKVTCLTGLLSLQHLLNSLVRFCLFLSSLRFDRFSSIPELTTRFGRQWNSENLTLKREIDNRIHLKPSPTRTSHQRRVLCYKQH